jgi:hypothetical protein
LYRLSFWETMLNCTDIECILHHNHYYQHLHQMQHHLQDHREHHGELRNFMYLRMCRVLQMRKGTHYFEAETEILYVWFQINYDSRLIKTRLNYSHNIGAVLS